MQKTIAEINHYTSFTVNPLSLPEQTYELYSVPSYDSGLPEIIQGKEIGSTKVAVRENDVLVCKINPRINRVWVVKHHTQHPLIASSEWIVIRSPENDCEYLKWYFMSPKFHRMMVSQVTGIGGSLTRAQPKQVATYPVPIPDLPTQRRIAATLDKVSEGIALCKQMLADLDELVKSQFVEMFGDLETNPKGYEQRKLRSLANKISDGVHAKPEYTETGRPFISVVNINKGVIDFEECKFVSEDAYQKMIKSTHPERGDILYTKVGATYGIPAYVDTDTEFCLYVSVCLIKPKHDEIDARFLALSMSMPYIKRQADSRIKGIGVPDLHLNQIREFDVICPPRHEQEAFVTFVEQIDKSKFAVQQQLVELETLKESLMQEYFG